MPSPSMPPQAQPVRRTAARPVRVALIGCGAVSRASILPVLAAYDDVVLSVLVDRDEGRARALASDYGLTHVMTDADRLTSNDVDAVILATPPAHHAPATIAFAAKGLHVFVEKPMAIRAADAQAMVDATDRAGVALSVGLYRRFLPSVQLLRTLIERQEFGRPLAVDAEEGGAYGWQLATLDVLTKSAGGGGVLIDIGSHVIDVILHVMGATAALDRYEDNDRGGIETDCLLRASLHTSSGLVPLRLELSRTRELRGSIRIQCEHATLELMRPSFTEVLVHRNDQAPGSAPIRFSASWAGVDNFVGYEAFRLEFTDWVNAITKGTEPMLSGRSVVPVVRLIEDAYTKRVPLIEPGLDDAPAAPPVARVSTPRRRVLVTGAGGFLGGRTVELLRDRYGWDAVPLIREPKGAARLARWPIEISLGDICSRADMDRVLKGCDAVVHCAVGTSWKADETRRATVDGTRIVAEAALAAGAKRFVHISTLFVHEREGLPVIDENAPLRPQPGDSYGRNKLDAEEALAAVAKGGLQTIILRPTRIYGPFSKTFTERPLRALTEGRLAIGGNAGVPANMVYIDTVVEAIERALEAPESLSGSAYLVTDEDQVTLQEFYDFFGRPGGAAVRLLPDWRMPGGEAATPGLFSRWASGVRGIARSSEFRGLVRRVLDTDPIGTLPRKMWDRSPGFQQKMLRRFGSDPAVVYRPAPPESMEPLVYIGEPARVSGAKAERELGLHPTMPRSRAMDVTLAWARYARLL